MASPVNWSKAKAIVLESDDWGGVARTARPNADACKKAERFWAPMEGKYDSWHKGTLEAVEQMQRLFDLLQAHRGGDGRAIVFSPMVLNGNPDFEAIYMASWEVAQLTTTGVSAAIYGSEIICRNLSDGKREISAPVPAGAKVTDVVDLRTERHVAFLPSDGGIRFNAGPGNYSVKMKE